MGRSIEFDIDETLDLIIQEFWKHGFNKTSMSIIEKATNVKKASLYGAFGDKDAMFKLALNKYFTKSSSKNKKRGIEFIESFFKNLIDQATSGKHPNGCLVMNSALELTNTKCSKWELSQKYLNQIKDKIKFELDFAKDGEQILELTNVDELGNWLFTQAFLIRELSKITSDQSYFDPIKNNINLRIKQQRI